MNRYTLRDKHHHIIGYIDTASDGKQTGRNANHRIVGYYEPRSDITRDANHHIVAHCNVLASLITAG